MRKGKKVELNHDKKNSVHLKLKLKVKEKKNITNIRTRNTHSHAHTHRNKRAKQTNSERIHENSETMRIFYSVLFCSSLFFYFFVIIFGFAGRVFFNAHRRERRHIH